MKESDRERIRDAAAKAAEGMNRGDHGFHDHWRDHARAVIRHVVQSADDLREADRIYRDTYRAARRV